MTAKQTEILTFMNQTIVEENGTPVKFESALHETNLDSFGYTVLFLELDSKYNIFKDVSENEDPFKTIDWENITVKEVINRCL